MAKTDLLVNYPDLGEKVYEVIRDRIVTCELAPGSQLPVVEIARELGVSLTPVRDALNRLAAEGLVEDVARKGYFVARLDPEDVIDLLDARRLIESAAAEQGVELVDSPQLHEMRRLVEEMERFVDEQGAYSDYAEFSKRDSQFHLLIVGSARNRHLLDIYRRLGVHLHIYRTNLAAQTGGPRRGLSDVRDHRAILAGIETHDVPAIKAAITRHVQQVANSLATAKLTVV
jgi:DNA-binding GntR family transcriptional regulator